MSGLLANVLGLDLSVLLVYVVRAFLLVFFIISCCIMLWPHKVWCLKTQRRQDCFTSFLILLLGFSILLLGTIGNVIEPAEVAEQSSPASGVHLAVDLQPPDQPIRHLENSIYQAIQILSFNGNIKEHNTWLVVAGDCAVLLALLLGFEILRRWFFRAFMSVYFIMPNWRRKMICGLGHVGGRLLDDLGDKGWLIVVEKEKDNLQLERAREMGATVIHGDSRSEKLLSWLGADLADEVFLTTGNDEVNLEAALDIARLMQRKRPLLTSNPINCGMEIFHYLMRLIFRRKPKVYVQINDPQLQEILMNSIRKLERIQPEKPLYPQFILFNAMEKAAEEFVCRDVLQHKPADDQVMHYVIVGFNRMAQQLILKLAEYAQFSNHKRHRVTLLHAENEKQEIEDFLQRYPRLTVDQEKLRDQLQTQGLKYGWQFPEVADEWNDRSLLENPEFDHPQAIEYAVNMAFIPQKKSLLDSEFHKNLMELVEDQHVKPVLIICTLADTGLIGKAEELRGLLEQKVQKYQAGPEIPLPMYLYIPTLPQIADVIDLEPENEPPHQHIPLKSFGQCNQCCTHDRIANSLREQLADVIFTCYSIKKEAHYQGTKSIRQDAVTKFDYKSNYGAALFADYLLDRLDLQVMPLDKAQKNGRMILSKAEVEELINEITTNHPEKLQQLGAMEHNRWVVERLLDGWTYEALPGDYSSYDKAELKAYKKLTTQRKVRHQFIPFQILTDDEKDKDTDQVLHIIKACSGHFAASALKEKFCLVRKSPGGQTDHNSEDCDCD